MGHLDNPTDDFSARLLRQFGSGHACPPRLEGWLELLQHMRDAALAAAQMKCHVRAHDRPTQAWSRTDRSVDVLDRGKPTPPRADCLPPQRRLQPVRQMARRLLADVDRPFADMPVEV